MFFLESKITCDIPQILKSEKTGAQKKYDKTWYYK